MLDEQTSQSGQAPTTEAIRSRVDELIAEMTPEEKAGQLTQYFYFKLPPEAEVEPALSLDLGKQPLMVEEVLGQGLAGSLLFVTDPAETNRLQRLAVEGNRLGIPALFGFDVIHGLRTILPVPIAMAASWDPATIERGQAVAAREARAVGIHWAFAPMIDIARDPRWGRITEAGGEDPFLGAAVAVAQVRGFQGSQIGAPEGVIAGPKHFAGYGAAFGGRDYDEVNISDSELWNVYLPPFQAAVEAGAGNIMTAYMPLNGIPATANRWLLTDVLRGTWGFEGFVVSDANAVKNLLTHGFAEDLTDAGVRALNVGLDMEMAMGDPAYGHLAEALEAGRGEPGDAGHERAPGARGEAPDGAVRRAVRRRGSRPRGAGRPRAPRGGPDHRRAVGGAAAERGRRAAAGRRQPLLDRGDRPARRLQARHHRAVGLRLRPGRDRDGAGGHSQQGRRGRAGRVRARGPGRAPGLRVDVRHVRRQPAGGPARVRRRRRSSSGRSIWPGTPMSRWSSVGEWQNMIGEAASRSSLELPGHQLELLQAVVETGTPVVLLVMNGRPLDLRWAAEHVPAILDIWYPGTQGGAAVANLLFGDVSPGGKLPFTWPRTVGQVPMVYSHTRSHEPENQWRRYWDEESTPLFPFGHGLSYGRFSYADLAVDRTTIGPEDTLDGLGGGHQRRRSAGRRGRAALHPSAARLGRAADSRAQGLRAGQSRAGGVAYGSVHARAGGVALLECRGSGLGDRILELRRLGRGRLDRRALDDLRAAPSS